MVVDDEQGTNTLAAEYLRLSGFEVLAVYDAGGALAALAAGEAVALVVADQRLPDRSGLELCVEIKALRPGLPVVLLSATGTGRREEAGGPDCWIAKPFRPKDLVDEVRRLL